MTKKMIKKDVQDEFPDISQRDLAAMIEWWTHEPYDLTGSFIWAAARDMLWHRLNVAHPERANNADEAARLLVAWGERHSILCSCHKCDPQRTGTALFGRGILLD